MRVQRVHHIALKVRDVQRVAAFYRDLLGCSEDAQHVDEGGLRSIWLSSDESIVMIERATTLSAEPPAFADDPPGLHLLAFAIARQDRDAWRRRLEDAGHPVVKETGFTLYVLDPEGNRVGLSHWPEV